MSPISAILLRLEHARLSQGNGEETIERRYRQYLRIEPQMRLRKNASFVLRGYPIGDEIGGGHTRSHQGGSYDSRRRTENERQTHSILGHVDQRRPSSSQNTDPQCRVTSSYPRIPVLEVAGLIDVSGAAQKTRRSQRNWERACTSTANRRTQLRHRKSWAAHR